MLLAVSLLGSDGGGLLQRMGPGWQVLDPLLQPLLYPTPCLPTCLNTCSPLPACPPSLPLPARPSACLPAGLTERIVKITGDVDELMRAVALVVTKLR